MPDDYHPRIQEVDDYKQYYQPNIGEDDLRDFEDMDDISVEEEIEQINTTFFEEGHDDDDAELTFRKHNDSVSACTLHPLYDWAVTGSMDNRILIWHTESGETLAEIKDHKQPIKGVKFSYDGVYLASGDNTDEVFVHEFVKGETEEVLTVEKACTCYVETPIYWMRWHHMKQILLTGNDSGQVHIWTMPAGSFEVLAGPGTDGCTAGVLTRDCTKLLTGYADGTLQMWDFENKSVLFNIKADSPILSHRKCVASIDGHRNSSMFMSSDSFGKIIFSSNDGPYTASRMLGPVDWVGFPPSAESKLAASCTWFGMLTVWECNDTDVKILWEHDTEEHTEDITNAMWLTEHVIMIASAAGKIYGYEATTGNRLFKLVGHAGHIFKCSFDPRQGILLTASIDGSAKIFRLRE